MNEEVKTEDLETVAQADEIEETVESEITLEPVIEEAPPEDVDIRHCEKIIEAVLFAAGYPVSYEKLAAVLSLTRGAVKRIVREYAEVYNRADGDIPRGIMLLCYEASCQLCTCEQYGTYVREALGIKRGGNLSQSSIETLAIVAYNEPVTRAFIETVRGVDSTYAVNSLLEKNLIESCGRLDVPGRPRLYRTTENFLRVFGIESLSELPEVDVPTGYVQEKIIVPEDETAQNEEIPEESTDFEGE